MLNWKFNGWAKYKNYRVDNKVNLRIKNHYKGNVISPKYNKKSIVLEGGAIDVNGKGLLLTTKECLLSKIQQRNSFLKIKDYNHIFKKFFGVKKVIWLNKGIVGDDTHGHVDDIARFVKSNKVFIAYENNKKDKKVIKIFKKEFNNRKIIPIDCSDLIWGFGAIHCLTQQEPK